MGLNAIGESLLARTSNKNSVGKEGTSLKFLAPTTDHLFVTQLQAMSSSIACERNDEQENKIDEYLADSLVSYLCLSLHYPLQLGDLS